MISEMDEAERQRFDEAERNGTLGSLRLRVRSLCAPIWWEINRNTILGNGSMSVIATPQAIFGVTANHVVSTYEGDKARHTDLFCQLGSAPFDPGRAFLRIRTSRAWRRFVPEPVTAVLLSTRARHAGGNVNDMA